MRIGRYSVETVVFGEFRLDGGSMFGSVPKNIWNKSIPADSENCIPLTCRSLILRDDSRVILIDVGIGDKWSDKLKQIYGITLTPRDQLNFAPESVTDVILTHLHFDHAGGISHRKDDGQLALTYPNATVHLQRANWERANNPTPKDRASYLTDNIAPLNQADLKLYDGTQEILPEITVHRVDGHTPGQQWIEVGSKAERMFFPTDLVPTSHHVPIPFHMGYDMCAETILQEKLAFMEHAVAPGVTVCFQHDRDVAFATIIRSERSGFEAKKLG